MHEKLKMGRQIGTLVLLAAYPVLFLYAQNQDQIRFEDTLRALLGVVVVALITFLLIYRVSNAPTRPLLSAAIVTMLFFSFGHVYWPLRERLMPENLALFNLLVCTAWIALAIVSTWLVWHLRQPDVGAQFAGALALTLFALTAANLLLARGSATSTGPQNQALPPPLNPPALTQNASAMPDVYYIILDGYGRADVLEALYGYDNTPFIQFLEDQGFFVAKQGLTNYNRTVLSLASSTNLDYIDQIAPGEGAQSTNYALFDELIRDSRARQFLESLGYRTIVISSGYQPTELTDSAQYLSSRGSIVSGFERLLLRNTPLGILPALDQYLSYEAHRQRVLYALEALTDLARERDPAPRFVFAHVLAPHPPFVFAADGAPITPERPYYLGDANDYRGTQAEYIAGYRDQVNYLNQLLVSTISSMLAEADEPPIIILQGDHGPGGFSDFRSAADSCLYERAGILNAYYLPEPAKAKLFDTITPVNSFRLIFDTYFGTDLGLLADRSYFGAMPFLFEKIDITDEIDATVGTAACRPR